MNSPTIAIDACAALHGKQTSVLRVLDCFVADAHVVMPTSVYGEAVEMSLSGWLDKHGVEPCRVRRNDTNAMRNKCRKNRWPGKKDLELVAAAVAADAVLLSHDELAAEAGRRLGLLVVDLPDLVGFAYHQRWIDDAALEQASTELGNHAWRAPDWSGGVLPTIAARARYSKTAAELRERWDLVDVAAAAASVGGTADSSGAEPTP